MMFFCKNTYILIRENTPPHFNICLTFEMISGVHFNSFFGILCGGRTSIQCPDLRHRKP